MTDTAGILAYGSLIGEPGAEIEPHITRRIVSRCIERIGDNAVDIGEQTAFVVTGEFTEFTDASH